MSRKDATAKVLPGPHPVEPAHQAPPTHLEPATASWWAAVASTYQLEAHHYRILTAAGEAWDRYQQARKALAEHGLTFEGKDGIPRARPEVAIERDSRIAFARLVRELSLDPESAPDPRPPRR